MKYIYVQPSIERFSWELKTSIYSLKKLGVDNKDIVILFTRDNPKVVSEFNDYQTFSFNDDRSLQAKKYIPSIRPYLWYRFLNENPEYTKEDFFYLDSDTVLVGLPADNQVSGPDNVWYCSDTIGYIGYDYIKSVTNSGKVLDVMSETLETPLDWVKDIQSNSGGAQWIIKKPKASYWYDVYSGAVNLYYTLEHLDTSLQKWTAEMWSQLWTMYHYELTPKVLPLLDFSWSTDDEYKGQLIIHNAGVTEDMKDMFFKGIHLKTPTIEELKQSSGKVSDIYVGFVRKALYGDEK